VKIEVKFAENKAELDDIKAIRIKVFQEEQCVTEELDFDGLDDECIQLIAYDDGRPVGTARLREIKKDVVKVERMAVTSEARRQGVGKKLLGYILEYLETKDVKEAVLNAQERAKGFYEGFGFKQEGGIFDDAGIPHIKMAKILDTK